MSVTTQKDYLKKYLSIGKDSTEKKKKKKKVKSSSAASRLVIIDDNADTFENAVKEDLLEDEDAPQIVAVIDDRPPSLRVDEKNNTNLWIPIGSNNVNSLESSSSSSKNLGDISPPRNRIKLFSKKNEDMSPPRRHSSSVKHNSDKILDNKRFKIKEENEDMSPPRKSTDKIIDYKMFKIKEENEDISPPRKNSSTVLRISKKGKPSRWGEEVSDVSPTRHDSVNRNEQNKKYDDHDNSPPRKRSQVTSPGKLNKENSSRGMSNDFDKKIDEDISPPRKRTKDTYPEKLNKENSSRRMSNDLDKKIDDDMSPPRKRTKDTYPEKGNKKKSSRWESEEIGSSSSRHDIKKSKNKYGSEDNSPPRKKSEISHPTKMMKTLDGKTAGLQNAKQLAAETTLINEKERELFNQMSSEMSGANATTIVRDKKTGRVRNFQEEAARDLAKKKKEEENKAKYSRWGRGLKQVEDATKRRDEELNEMNKPLARYANDEDLERYLKEQEREGDPMLAYIRKKKRKKDVEEGKPMKPEYMGEFMPNRFGIRPGHRWDGVDRSNGYEKKWFDIQNSRMAQQEEAYKWSTEDM